MNASNRPERSASPPGFSHGFVAHLMTVTHFVMRETLDRLTDSNRYQKLSMTYERYIAVLAEGDIAPGELANRVGSSKQACSKVIKELEKLELIHRHDNPHDGRSKLLSLSNRGMALLLDGNRTTMEVQQELADRIGVARMTALVDLLERVRQGLGVQCPSHPALERVADIPGTDTPVRLNGLLQALSNHFRDSLSAEINARGYKGLRNNFGQILGAISREPRRIQYIASVVGISKQAAAMMAIEFETLGYVNRTTDPDDRRQLILSLSPRGEQLVQEAIARVRVLEQRVLALLGEEDYRQLEAIMADLYSTVTHRFAGLGAEAGKIQKLTEFLLEELGVDGVKALAQHLTTVTRGNA